MSIGKDHKVREAVVGRDDDAVTALMIEYLTWGHERLREEYGIEDPPAEIALVRRSLLEYRQPAGVLLLAEYQAEPAGVGALRWLDDGVAEIKRMYVRARWRGSHLGSALLDRLLEEARARSATMVRLDTVRFMFDAQRLYRSRGFVERSLYDGSEVPAHLRQYWLFFERHLSQDVG